jgi:hypothetical protein
MYYHKKNGETFEKLDINSCVHTFENLSDINNSVNTYTIGVPNYPIASPRSSNGNNSKISVINYYQASNNDSDDGTDHSYSNNPYMGHLSINGTYFTITPLALYCESLDLTELIKIQNQFRYLDDMSRRSVYTSALNNYLRNNIINTPKKGKIRLRLFGDLYDFNYHWLKKDEINDFKFMLYNTKTTLKTNYIPYICSCNYFKDDTNDILNKNNERYSKKDFASGKAGGWALLKAKGKNVAKNLEETDDRIYCMGCSMNVDVKRGYILSCIDVKSKLASFFICYNRSIVTDIVKLYNDYKKEYKNVEQWLYDYDIIIDFNDKTKPIISCEKTDLLCLNGSIEIIKPEVFEYTSICDQSFNQNLYNGKKYIDNYFKLIKNPINIFSFEKDKFKIINSGSIKKEMALQDGQMERMFSKKIARFRRFIEL